jgi:hypothetical protein
MDKNNCPNVRVTRLDSTTVALVWGGGWFPLSVNFGEDNDKGVVVLRKVIDRDDV